MAAPWGRVIVKKTKKKKKKWWGPCRDQLGRGPAFVKSLSYSNMPPPPLPWGSKLTKLILLGCGIWKEAPSLQAHSLDAGWPKCHSRPVCFPSSNPKNAFQGAPITWRDFSRHSQLPLAELNGMLLYPWCDLSTSLSGQHKPHSGKATLKGWYPGTQAERISVHSPYSRWCRNTAAQGWRRIRRKKPPSIWVVCFADIIDSIGQIPDSKIN